MFKNRKIVSDLIRHAKYWHREAMRSQYIKHKIIKLRDAYIKTAREYLKD